jgi:hypothetical protein
MKVWVLLLAAIAILPGATGTAQDISGTWQGILGTDASSFGSRTGVHTVLRISKGNNGGWKAVYYDNVAASKRPVRISSLTLAHRDLVFSIESMHLHYLGKLSADGRSILGIINDSPLEFRRMAAGKPVTPEQLKQMLAAGKGVADEAVAREVYGLELTERLSAAEVSRYESEVSGIHARPALMALLDRSSFLDAAGARIDGMPAPEIEAQRKMLALAVDYVTKTMNQLPNLYATRLTSSFVRLLWDGRPMRPAGTFRATILYRDGKERLHAGFLRSAAAGLITSGEFGPVLADALVDGAHGNLTWNRWEQGAEGPEAVYRYSVTAERSHYVVDRSPAAYDGEVAIDPNEGTILRLVFRANLEPPNPLLGGEVLVEYGPVEMGGKTYICPLRSVALSHDTQIEWLNDVVFEEYHLYRASTRLIMEPEEDSPKSN